MISKQEYRDMRRQAELGLYESLAPNEDGPAMGQLKEALEKKWVRPEDFSIRKLAEAVVPDGREWVETMDPRFGGGSFLEASGAVSVSSFSNITGQIVYNRLLQGYASDQFIFSNLVETVPTMFNGERIAGIGGIGDKASQVNEGSPYPVVGVNEDYIDTPATTKKGMIIPLTKEALFFDRTNLILTRAAECGQFLGVNKEKDIINCVIDENDTSSRYIWKGTTYATYQTSTPWINVKTSNGLTDWTNIDAALLIQSQILDPSTGLPVVIIGSDLVVAQQNAMTAHRIVRATSVDMRSGGYATSGNLTGTYSPSPLTEIPGYAPPTWNIRTSKLLSAQMGTKTSWYMGDVNAAVAWMENWPITVVQAAPNSEQEFANDIVIRYKASHRGHAATKDPRKLVKSTA